MSVWWLLLIVPLAYVVVGWVVAWVDASNRVRARPECKQCGAKQHAPECTCADCRNRTFVCREHRNDETGVIVAIWPLLLAVEAGDWIGRLWSRYINPAVVVERKAERARMHVLVDAPKEVEDRV